MTSKRSDFGSLESRISGSPTHTASAAPAERSLDTGLHVWVKDGSEETAGLLAGWRKDGNGWWGRVIMVSAGQPSETLVRADLLRKA